jgi:hypothetical protein
VSGTQETFARSQAYNASIGTRASKIPDKKERAVIWKQRILGASRAATAIRGEVMVVQYRHVGIGFMFSLLLSAMTAELHAFWSMPGLTGIVDESSAALVLFNDTGSASVRSAVSKAVVKLRYPVTGGPFPNPQADTEDVTTCMTLLLRDTGPESRVIARLVKIGLFTDQKTVLATVDSDTVGLAPSAAYQTAGVCGLADPDFPEQGFGFDYANFSYYVEVELIKTGSTGNPGIKHVGIFNEEV